MIVRKASRNVKPLVQMGFFLFLYVTEPVSGNIVTHESTNSIKEFEYEFNTMGITNQCLLCSGRTVLEEIKSKNISHFYEGYVTRG